MLCPYPGDILLKKHHFSQKTRIINRFPMKTILNEEQIKNALISIADSIIKSDTDNLKIAIIGIRSRGEILAQRLTEILTDKQDTSVPCGTLDISLYRDDFNVPQGNMVVGTTEIDFDINDSIIILVDDVLHTGRSVRAALDALVDLGRPKAIRLAVLVDRGGREYPIQADYVGMHVDIADDNKVEVLLKETDENEQVVVG